MNDDLLKLYDAASAKAYFDDGYTPEQFAQRLSTADGQQAFYEFLVAQNEVEMLGQFKAALSPSSKKKALDVGQPSSGSSAQPSQPSLGVAEPQSAVPAAGEQTPASDPGVAQPMILGMPAQQVARDAAPAPMPGQQPSIDLSRLSLNGSEDPIQHGERLRQQKAGGEQSSSYEYQRKYAAAQDVRQGVRDLESAAMYGEDAKNQATLAAEQLALKFGQGWEAEVSAITSELAGMQEAIQQGGQIDQSRAQQLTDRYKQYAEDPFFEKWIGGNAALGKAGQVVNDLANKPGALKEARYMAEQAQESADKDYSTSMWRPKKNFILRKTGEIIGGVASLPRTVAGMLPDSGNKWGWTDSLASWGDEITDSAQASYPKPTALQPGVFQQIVDFNGAKVVLEGDGKPRYILGDDGKLTKPDASFTEAFTKAGGGSGKRMEFSGAAPLVDKVASAAVDLALMRGIGGGTKAGTFAVSAFLNHQNAYKNAMAAGDMSPDDAAEYALVSSLMLGGLEAYVGNLESAMFKPAAASVKAMGARQAVELAGKMSGGQRAWAAIKPTLTQIGEENLEEIASSAASDVISSAYSDKIDREFEAQNILETVAVTSLLTAPAAGFGILGHQSASRRSAIMAAVNSPERAKEVLQQVVSSGAITQEDADKALQNIQRLAVYNENLPDGLTFEQRSQALAAQEWRDRNDAVAKDEGVMPAQRAAARDQVKMADDMVREIVAPKPAEDTEGKTPDPTPDNTPAALAEPSPTPVPVEPDPVEPDAQADAEPEFGRFGVAGIQPGPLDVADLSVSIDDARAYGRTDDIDATTEAQREVYDQALGSAVGILEARGWDVPERSQPALGQALADEIFNGQATRRGGQSLAEAIEQIAVRFAQEKELPRQSGTTLSDMVEAEFADGLRLAAQDVPASARQAYSEPGGVSIGVAAKVLAKKAGVTEAEAKEAMLAAMSDAPDMNFRESSSLRSRQAVLSDPAFDVLSEAERAQAVEVSEQVKASASASAEDQQAVTKFAEANNFEPKQMASAITTNNTDAQQLASESPTVYGQLQSAAGDEPGSDLPQDATNADSQTEAEPPPQQGEGTEDAGVTGNQGGDVPTPSEVSGLTAEEIIALPPVAEEITRPIPEALAAAAQAGLPVVDGQQSTEGLAEAMDAQSEEVAAVSEAIALAEAATMAGVPRNTIPAPIFFETDTEFVVTSSPARDALRDAGGKWSPARGWVFPIGKKQAAIAAASGPLNTPPSSRKSWGKTAEGSMAMRDPATLVAEQRRGRRIAKAGSLEERLAVAAADLGLQDGERVLRVTEVAKQMSAAFPNVPVTFTHDPDGPAGSVDDGKVTINLAKAGVDTPLHEFGHVWALAAKTEHPALHAEGLAIMSGSEYHKAVMDDPRYQDLTAEQQLEEALALAIGERGARLMSASRWQRFVSFLGGIRDMAQSMLRGAPIETTAAQFADRIASQLLDKKAVSWQGQREIAVAQEGKARFMFVAEDAEFEQEQRQALRAAKAMEENGYDNGAIWTATNWSRGADGKWRWEVSDAGATLNLEMALVEDGEVFQLGDIFTHPELYAVYPDLANLPVIFSDELPVEAAIQKGPTGWYMAVRRGTANPTLSILHEVQHVVQLSAGFGRGTTPENAVSDIEAALKQAIADHEADPSAITAGRIRLLVDAAATDRRAIYEAFAGEVEARNTARRAKAANYDLPPESTEDVARSAQIVIFGEADMAESPADAPSRTAALLSAARQIVNITAQERTARDMAVPRIAERFGIDERAVNQMWDEADAVLAKGQNLVDIQGREASKPFLQRLKKAAQMQFSYRGLLPKDVFTANQARERRVSAILSRMNKRAAALEEAMAAGFKETGVARAKQFISGVKIPDSFRQQVDAALKGEGNIDVLPPDVAAAVKSMRALVDQLSKEMLYSGAMSKPMVLKVLDGVGVTLETGIDDPIVNALSTAPYERTDEQIEMVDMFLKEHSQSVGTYLNRSYRVHDYPDWRDRVPTEAMARARAYFVRTLKQQADEIETNLAEFEQQSQAKIDHLDQRIADAKAKMESMTDTEEPLSATGDAEIREEVEGVLAEDTEGAVHVGLEIGNPVSSQAAAALAREAKAAAANAQAEMAKMESVRSDAKKRLDAIYARLANIDGEIGAFLADQSPGAMFAQGAVMGSKNTGILKARKDIPDELRELMGEYKDPTVNFSKSVYKLANLIANQEFLNEMLIRYEGVYFFGEGSQRPPGFDTLIAPTSSRAMAPLNGYRTSEDIAASMKDFYERQTEAEWQAQWMKIVQMVKLGKTVFSPVTQARNFWGNTSFWVANGWNPTVMVREGKEFFARNNDPKAWEDKIAELHELGVLGESVNAGEMKEMFRAVDSLVTDEAVATMSKATYGASDAVSKAARGVYGMFKGAYELGDSFYRVMGYEAEKRRYAQALFGGPFDTLTTAQQKEVSKKAAGIVNAVLPTYSYVPKMVRALRRFPFTGTFVAFPAEMVRVTYNIAALAQQEMKDPRTRAFGIMRMAGLGTVTAGTYALVAIAQSLFGYDDEEWGAVSEFVEPYKKNAQLVPLPRGEKGQVRYVNLGYTDPFAWLKKPLAAVSAPAGTVFGNTIDGFGEFLSPFISPDLVFKTVSQVAFNTDDRGNDVYVSSLRESMSNSPFLHPENIRRIARFTAKRLQPGLFKSGWDAYDILTNTPNSSGRILNVRDYLTSHFLGVQAETIDPTVQAGYMFGQMGREIREVRGIVSANQNASNRAWKNLEKESDSLDAGEVQERKDKLDVRSNEALASAHDFAQEAHARIMRDAIRKVDALRKIGIEESSIEELLNTANFTAQEVSSVMAGNPSVILVFKRKGRY